MKVKFIPIDKELEIKSGQSVMELAHENGIDIKSVCNGMPSCAECRVRVVDGDWNVLPPTSKEVNLIGTGYFVDQRRLSCQLRCFGDVTVDVTEQLEKSKEDLLTKKFLERAQKGSAEESHSVGGIFVEQESAALENFSTETESSERETDGQSGGILTGVSSSRRGSGGKKSSRNSSRKKSGRGGQAGSRGKSSQKAGASKAQSGDRKSASNREGDPKKGSSPGQGGSTSNRNRSRRRNRSGGKTRPSGASKSSGSQGS